MNDSGPPTGRAWTPVRGPRELCPRGESLFDALEYRNYKMPLKALLEGHPREDVAAVFQLLLEQEMEAVVRIW